MCVSSQLHVGGDGVDFKDTAIEVINLGICLPQNKKKKKKRSYSPIQHIAKGKNTSSSYPVTGPI